MHMSAYKCLHVSYMAFALLQFCSSMPVVFNLKSSSSGETAAVVGKKENCKNEKNIFVKD